MAHKVFINNTDLQLAITLEIRASSNPANTSGTKNVAVAPRGTEDVPYGDAVDIYLNGLTIAAMLNGEIDAQTRIVTTRGSALDDLLNTHTMIAIDWNGADFSIVAVG